MAAYYNEIEPYAAQWLRNLIKKGLIADGTVDERSIVDVDPLELARENFTQAHFFAGIGGWSHALRLAGWPDDRPIWTGSCPCQPFSVAGKGAGTDDPRHLWPHFHRLISAVRPPVVMGEQVAGQAGYGWLDGVRADLAREGYASRGVDIPACSVDAPHIRQRLYWVAMANSMCVGRQGSREMGEPCNSTQGRNWQAGDAFHVGSGADGSGHMADADDAKRRQDGARGDDNHRNQAGWDQDAGDVGACDEGDVADASIIGRKKWERQDGQQDAGGGSQGGLDPAGAGSFWSDHIWLTGADGKSRRSQPGLPLLAHGIPNRVGRLRAYGNAIVAPLAKEVIMALMEVLDGEQSLQEDR